MDAFVKPLARDPNSEHDDNRPDRSEVEAALRTIIRWTGDDPDRTGLLETPARVTRAFEEYFAGYAQDPALLLQKTFEEIEGYDEMIVLGGIPLESHCEHHLAPIIGRAWVAYVPRGRVVGISKLARVVDAYAKRLQIQEKMTAQIADTIERGSAAPGRRSHHQGDASLHDDARRAQARHGARDEPHARMLSKQSGVEAGISVRRRLAAPNCASSSQRTGLRTSTVIEHDADVHSGSFVKTGATILALHNFCAELRASC